MGKFLFFLLLTAFFAGAAVSTEGYFQFFSLHGLVIRAEDPVAESFFWKNISPDELRFWPLFLWRTDELKKKIETESPLSLKLTGSGIFRFYAELLPLQPWILVHWKDKNFYLTKDGLIWDAGHILNKSLSGIKDPEGPPFFLADDLPSPSQDPEGENLVMKSVLPVDFFADWVEGLETSGWMPHTETVEVSRREGRYLLSLNLKIRSRTVRILLRGDVPRWKDLSSAVSQILHQLQFSGENIIIDTTYTDRIIVRNVEGGGQEGSGK